MSELEKSHFIDSIVRWWDYFDNRDTDTLFFGMLVATPVTALYYDDMLFLFHIVEIKGEL